MSTLWSDGRRCGGEGGGSPPPIWYHSVTAPTPGLLHLTLPLSCHCEEPTSSCHTTLSIAISSPYVVCIYIFRHLSLLFLVCTTSLAHMLSSWLSLPLLSFPPMSLSLSRPCSSLSFDLPPLLLLHLLNMHSPHPQFSPSPSLPPSLHPSLPPLTQSLPLLPSLPPLPSSPSLPPLPYSHSITPSPSLHSLHHSLPSPSLPLPRCWSPRRA